MSAASTALLSAPSAQERRFPSILAQSAAVAERLTHDQIHPATAVTLPVLEDGHDRPVDLTRTFAHRGVLLTFYVGGWSEPCTRALQELEGYRERLAERGYGVVAVSPEAVKRLHGTIERNGLGFLAVHDHGSRFAQSVGLVFRIEADARAALRSSGVRLQVWNGEASGQLPVAATLLIGADRHFQVFAHTGRVGPRTDVSDAVQAALAA